MENQFLNSPGHLPELSKELREAFNAEIENMKEDGTLAEISEKYYGYDISIQE